MTPIFKAFVDFGHLKMNDIDGFNIYLKMLEGKQVDVIIRKHKESRTDQSNRYLWGVVYKMIAEETGHSAEDIHALLKTKFLKKLAFIKGKKYEVIQSTASLDKLTFSNYIEDCKRFAAMELDLNIPDPQKIVF